MNYSHPSPAEKIAAAARHYRDLINDGREKFLALGAENTVHEAGITVNLSLSSDKRDFISFALQSNALRFGTFTLKVM